MRLRQSIARLISKKADELQLQQLQGGQHRLESGNNQVCLDLQPFEHPFSLRDDDYKLKVKHNLHNRRYTSDTDLHPEAMHGGMQVLHGGLLLPEIDSREQLAPTAPHANS